MNPQNTKVQVGIMAFMLMGMVGTSGFNSYEMKKTIKSLETKLEEQIETNDSLMKKQVEDVLKNVDGKINEAINGVKSDFKIEQEQLKKDMDKKIQDEVKKQTKTVSSKSVPNGAKQSLGKFRISFYDTSHNSQEGWGFQTASGVSLKGKNLYDRLIACPPEIPLGTKVFLEFPDDPSLSGTYTCVDRGGAIKGNKIDVFFEDYNMEGTVWDMGIKYANVYLLGE